MTSINYTKAAVVVYDFGPFEGIVRNDYRWNGEAVAGFTIDEVARISEALAEHSVLMNLHPEETVTITIDADGVWEHQGYDDYDDPRGREVPFIMYEDERYYFVGDGFCWVESSEPLLKAPNGKPAPTRADAEAYYGKTMTVGQMIDYLSQFDRSKPVTIGMPYLPEGEHVIGEWMNVESVWPEGGDYDLSDDEVPSVIINGAADFDTRQW